MWQKDSPVVLMLEVAIRIIVTQKNETLNEITVTTITENVDAESDPEKC